VVLSVARGARTVSRTPNARQPDAGFTLIEMMVTIMIAGILMATATMALNAYTKAQSEKGTANRVVSSLRDAAGRAQAEGRTYCVSFDSATSWSLWRYSCDPSWTGTSIAGATLTATKVDSTSRQGQASIDMTTVAFPPPTIPPLGGLPYSCGAAGTGNCVYFYPRGIATAGQLKVIRPGTTKTYIVNVGGLTSRVYLG
jgi:prepilin-type N-terminal cleavage/methylation domain-containing protein